MKREPMKRLTLTWLAALTLLLGASSCKKESADTHEHNGEDIAIDTTAYASFFKKYPDFKEYEGDIKELYRKHNHYIWHEKKGLIEVAEVLYNRVNQLDDEGLPSKIPYRAKINELFENGGRGERPDMESELLISSMYFFYTKKVFEGMDTSKSRQTGWFLPREKVDYVAYLDTLMQDPKAIKGEQELFSQYFNLKKALQKYRGIQKKGGWPKIDLPERTKSLKEGDNNAAVGQLKKRLAAEGYYSGAIDTNFDSGLTNALKAYEEKHFREYKGPVTADMIKELNIPVEQRIKTITVNMERCRWVPADIDHKDEYIAVNIPSYRLRYIKDGKLALISNVVVGKELNKTVVFSGQMSYLVFAPYWNIPPSILEKEIKPGIEKNPNYLEEHNMEWDGDRVRQKPGGQNSLGLVKFMFPNSNNIYLHDTPAKSLFNKDERAFSHGCVRVERARDLAIALTKKEKNWTPEQVDEAMHGEKETTFALKKKIPVYIIYFTAFADEKGNAAFFDDVYNRDDRLAHLLYRD